MEEYHAVKEHKKISHPAFSEVVLSAATGFVKLCFEMRTKSIYQRATTFPI